MLINRSEFNEDNIVDYRYGNTYSTTFAVSKKIYKSLTGIMMLRHDYSEHDYRGDTKLPSSGKSALFLSPQLGYNFRGWHVSMLTDIPLYQYVNGRQLGNKYAFSFMVMRDIILKVKD